jgi:DNA-binding transcriptional regulator YiaG
VAKELGVSSDTVHHWALGQKAPKLQYRPTIHAFLGEEPPRESATTFPEALGAARRAMGLSQRRLAQLVGFGCPDTIADWEHGVRTPTPRYLERLKQFFERVGHPLAVIDLAAEKFAGIRSQARHKAWSMRRARRRV